MTESPICDVCDEESAPGGIPGDPEIDTICPYCEDLRQNALLNNRIVTSKNQRAPPHGNTTR